MLPLRKRPRERSATVGAYRERQGMATAKELAAVSDALTEALEAGEEIDPDELSAAIWDVVEHQRKRSYKYLLVGQDRRIVQTETEQFEENGTTAVLTTSRAHCPTWAQGPFYTAAEAALAARTSRQEHPDIKYMTVELFDADKEPKPKPEGIWA